MHGFFRGWQRVYIGRMLTFLMFIVTGAVALFLLRTLVEGIAFLQPVLIPLAIAAVIAFLVEPVVRVLCARTQMSRTKVVLILMGTFAVVAIGTGVWIVPRAYASAERMIKDTPAFLQKAQQRFFVIADAAQKKVESIDKKLPPAPAPGPLKVAPINGGDPVPLESSATPTPGGAAKPSPSPGADAQASPAPEASGKPSPALDANAKPAPSPGADGKPAQPAGDGMSSIDLNKDGRFDAGDVRQWISTEIPKYQQQIPQMLQKLSGVLFKAFGGFLGLFGVLLNAIIIPIYIFFLLTEARNLSKGWADYLPLKDSQFKQEVVSTLGEVHGYLVAFFRGQLIVSSIDAVLITTGLWIMGLNFSVVIGLLVLVLTFIPYLGIMICYVPAILIAIVQYGDAWHPFLVVLIMFGVQTLESTIISPKIVGESTGLHPLTVIVSVFAWEIILGGPIGALLAVPLTASLKVVMRRYVWDRARVRARILPTADVQPVLRAGDRDRFGDGSPDIQAVPEAVAHPHQAPDAPAGADTAHPPSGTKD